MWTLFYSNLSCNASPLTVSFQLFIAVVLYNNYSIERAMEIHRKTTPVSGTGMRLVAVRRRRVGFGDVDWWRKNAWGAREGVRTYAPMTTWCLSGGDSGCSEKTILYVCWLTFS